MKKFSEMSNDAQVKVKFKKDSGYQIMKKKVFLKAYKRMPKRSYTLTEAFFRYDGTFYFGEEIENDM